MTSCFRFRVDLHRLFHVNPHLYYQEPPRQQARWGRALWFIPWSSHTQPNWRLSSEVWQFGTWGHLCQHIPFHYRISEKHRKSTRQISKSRSLRAYIGLTLSFMFQTSFKDKQCLVYRLLPFYQGQNISNILCGWPHFRFLTNRRESIFASRMRQPSDLLLVLVRALKPVGGLPRLGLEESYRTTGSFSFICVILGVPNSLQRSCRPRI